MTPGTRRKAGYAQRAGITTPPSVVHELAAPGRPRAGQGGRWGLVLGGGGVLGAAWLIGALDALEQARGLDAREADVILGTSAGSVIGALLAGGVSVAEQRDRQLSDDTRAPARHRGTEGRGQNAGPDPSPGRESPGRNSPSSNSPTSSSPGSERRAQKNSRTTDALGDIDFDPDRAAGPAHPPRPRLRPGSPQLIRNNRGAFRQIPPLALLSGLAPTGRARLDEVARLVEHAVPAGQWPDHQRFRAVVLDYETGRRVVLGAPGAPRAGLSEAVLASCAIPGWFEPVTIGGRRYVDGGMWSVTNADLLAGEGLDELFVLAPMAATAYDTPTDWRVRIERRLRVRSTRRCLAEARTVHATGTAVTVITPGPDELALMGYNLMRPAGRKTLLRTTTRSTVAALEAAGAGPRADTVHSVLDLQELEDPHDRTTTGTGEAEPA